MLAFGLPPVHHQSHRDRLALNQKLVNQLIEIDVVNRHVDRLLRVFDQGHELFIAGFVRCKTSLEVIGSHGGDRVLEKSGLGG